MHIIRLPMMDGQGVGMLEASAGEQRRGTPSAGSKANRHDAPRERAARKPGRKKGEMYGDTSRLNELRILRGCGWAGRWRREDRKRGAGGLEGFVGLGLGGRGLRTRNRGVGAGRASREGACRYSLQSAALEPPHNLGAYGGDSASEVDTGEV